LPNDHWRLLYNHRWHIRVRIRIYGSRIEVPYARNDPPPSLASVVVIVNPVTGAPVAQVTCAEIADVAVPTAVKSFSVFTTASSVVMIRHDGWN
jgi:hypothetical protein